nr:GGDEF domain-containing protein [Marinobacter changyiensis]
MLEFRASHDSLTELPNRSLFMDRLRLAVSQARRNGQKFAVLFIDLNDFKVVNDTYGHGIGDQLLQKVAAGLKHCLREGDTLARYGGDEFMALLPSLDEKKDAATVARKLLTSLETPFHFEGCDLRVSIGISIGIALYPEDGDGAETLVERADMAMYAVKRKKKNDFYFYS